MFKRIGAKIISFFIPELKTVINNKVALYSVENVERNVIKGEITKFYEPYKIVDSFIGSGTYISVNSKVSFTSIGKFCSIGPNFLCGWGIHPVKGLSTSPYFYSTLKQNGATVASEDLFEERKKITIGNDVFIGANVVVLDGVVIGNGAVIGAGSIVSKDIPDYAVAYGNPIQIKKYRFNESQREKLKKIDWWNFDKEMLKDINYHFYDISGFIEKYGK